MTAPQFYERPSLNIETYDARAATVPGGDDIAFFRALAAEAGGPVLELGSGTGRVTLPMAEAGFEIVGRERSEAMRAFAGAKLAPREGALRERVEFVPGDMASFDLQRTFALVIVPFRAFQMLHTPEEQRSCLAAIRQHLAPAGRVAINLYDPWLDVLAPGWKPEDNDEHDLFAEMIVEYPATGNIVEVDTISHEADQVRQLSTEIWVFREVDDAGHTVREEVETLTMRWTYRYEMRYLLELSGFDVLAEYSDYDRAPPAYGGEQIWVATTRP